LGLSGKVKKEKADLGGKQKRRKLCKKAGSRDGLNPGTSRVKEKQYILYRSEQADNVREFFLEIAVGGKKGVGGLRRFLEKREIGRGPQRRGWSMGAPDGPTGSRRKFILMSLSKKDTEGDERRERPNSNFVFSKNGNGKKEKRTARGPIGGRAKISRRTGINFNLCPSGGTGPNEITSLRRYQKGAEANRSAMQAKRDETPPRSGTGRKRTLSPRNANLSVGLLLAKRRDSGRKVRAKWAAESLAVEGGDHHGINLHAKVPMQVMERRANHLIEERHIVDKRSRVFVDENPSVGEPR